MFKDDIDQFNEEAQRYDAYHQLGMKALAVLNDMDCRELADKIHLLVPTGMIPENVEIHRRARELSEIITFKDTFRQSMLDSLRMNITSEPIVLDLCFGINNFIFLRYDIKELKKKIEIVPSHMKGLCIRCIPYELYYLLQNILGPIINLLMKQKKKNKLSIMATPGGEWIFINIFSTGPGLSRLPPPDKEPLIDFSLEWNRSIEYQQFVDAREMTLRLGGEIRFSNREEGGLEVLLKLPLCHEESPIDTGEYDEHFDWIW